MINLSLTPFDVIEGAAKNENLSLAAWQTMLEAQRPEFRNELLRYCRMSEAERNNDLVRLSRQAWGIANFRLKGFTRQESLDLLSILCYPKHKLEHILGTVEPSVLETHPLLH